MRPDSRVLIRPVSWPDQNDDNDHTRVGSRVVTVYAPINTAVVLYLCTLP